VALSLWTAPGWLVWYVLADRGARGGEEGVPPRVIGEVTTVSEKA
jgi:hypothetical protein